MMSIRKESFTFDGIGKEKSIGGLTETETETETDDESDMEMRRIILILILRMTLEIRMMVHEWMILVPVLAVLVRLNLTDR